MTETTNSTKLLEDMRDAQKRALDQLEAWKRERGEEHVKLNDQVVEIGEAIKTIGDRVQALEKAIKTRATGVLPGIEDEVEQNGAVNPIKALFQKGSRDQEIVKEYTAKKRAALDVDPEYRDMTASDDKTGGYLISATMLPGWIPKARARSVVWKEAGITILENVNGIPLTIPTEDTDPTVQAVAENEAPTASDVDIGEMEFRPRVLRSLNKMSNRLLRLGPLAETIVRLAFERKFALEVDRILLRGTGTDKESLGIANRGGINNVEIGTNGGDFTFAVAEDMIIPIEESDLPLSGNVGDIKYVGHPRAWHTMKTERIAQYSGDTAGDYVTLPMSDQNVRDNLGRDFLKTTVIPKSLTKGSGTGLTEVYAGVWPELWLALWEDLVFKVSDVAGDATGSAFTQSQTWMVVEMEYDCNVAHAAAFTLVNDATGS